jgi:DNA-directed RNA polymerase subunit RPC12/RpoP
MSGIRTFFRHCPSCGRRFEIRLVKKEAVDSEELNARLPRPVNPLMARAVTPALPTRSAPTLLSNEVPSIVDIEEFQYTYRCKHCGHEWSEVHEKEESYSAPEGYTGD